MRSTHLATIAKVRFLVGALGERRGWWPSRFTDAGSRRSLDVLFPATSERAALESVVELARRDHDQRLGPHSFHVFRLPVHLQDRLAGFLASPKACLVWPPNHLEDVRKELEGLAQDSVSASAGPFCLGKPGRLGRRSGQFGLHFLGFYAEDGKYRSTIVGGL
ncbi:MAG: BrxE family protein [Polyangiaceae bacterium]|jgi:hypothetical protein|nr:BrxE family protein [Polyangiaceae bacterium]